MGGGLLGFSLCAGGLSPAKLLTLLLLAGGPEPEGWAESRWLKAPDTVGPFPSPYVDPDGRLDSLADPRVGDAVCSLFLRH